MALFVAVLFGLHPAHVEAVAWIAARKDVLFAAFFLLSLLAYLRYLRARLSHGWLVVSVLAFALSCLAKPQAVVLPLSLWLLDYVEQRPFKARVLVDKLPFLIVAGIVAAIALTMQNPEAGLFTFTDRVVASCYAISNYFALFIAPVKLSALHPFPGAMDAAMPPSMLASVLVIPIVLAALWFMRKQRLLVFGLAFFLLNIGHTLHLLKMNSSAYYERFTYLPYVGLLLMIALLYQRVVVKRWEAKWSAWVLASVCIVAASVGTFQRAGTWHDVTTLWEDVIATYPEETLGHTKLGIHLAQTGQPAKAVPYLQQAITLDPKNGFALNALGLLQLEAKNYNEAVSLLERAVQSPDATAQSWMNLALAYMNANKHQQAAQAFDQSIALNPGDPMVHLNRGFLMQRTKRYREAFEAFNRAIELAPNLGLGYHYRGKEHFYANNWQAAMADLNRAIELNAQVPASLYWRARCHAALGQKPQAVRDARAAQEAGYEVPNDFLLSLQSLNQQ